jgi:hypothetical protein
MLAHVVVAARRPHGRGSRRRDGDDGAGGVIAEIEAVVCCVHLHEFVAEEIPAEELARGRDVIPFGVGHCHDL